MRHAGPRQEQELEAAWTVAAVLGARPERRDRPGAPAGTHDFDLHLPDGRVVALEVTSSTVGEVRSMWDTIGRLEWSFPELASNWSISVEAAGAGDPGAHIGRLRQWVAPLLKVLEEERVSVFPSPGPVSPAAQTAIDALGELRVRGGSSAGGAYPGRVPMVVVGTTGPGGWTDGSSVNSAIEGAVTANLEKLLRAEADLRHLFLWVDWTDHASEAALALFKLPSAGPCLPDQIDAVWAATWQRNAFPESNIGALWMFTRDGGTWRSLQVPQVRTYATTVMEQPGRPSSADTPTADLD